MSPTLAGGFFAASATLSAEGPQSNPWECGYSYANTRNKNTCRNVCLYCVGWDMPQWLLHTVVTDKPGWLLSSGLSWHHCLIPPQRVLLSEIFIWCPGSSSAIILFITGQDVPIVTRCLAFSSVSNTSEFNKNFGPFFLKRQKKKKKKERTVLSLMGTAGKIQEAEYNYLSWNLAQRSES